MRTVSLIALIILFVSCGQQQTCRTSPAESIEVVEVEIDRAEQAFFESKSGDEVQRLLEKNPLISRGLLRSEQYPELSALAFRFYGLMQDPYIDTLYNEAVSAFEQNQQRFTAEMETAFSWMKYYFPEQQVPKIKTMVTGLYNDLYFTDSLIVVGIDYFIGDSASYPPLNMPQYILKRYNYDFLAPTLVKFYTTEMISTGKENTLLSEMIDYGKIYYLVGQLLPCMEDWRVIGFTEREMEVVKDNRAIIYANFNQNELWYDISQEMKRKFLGERPNVYEIHKECPGRVGAWMGWEIVQQYVEKTGVSMQQLLAETDHHKIFRESGYKPQ
jgi:hypothetical protein